MSGTIDVVIAGDCSAARAAAVSALERGQRVLVVLRAAHARAARRLRRTLLRTADADGSQLHVVTSAEVVCADGVGGVEAVVVRHAPTGHLSAVNASAFVSCDGSSQSRRKAGRNRRRIPTLTASHRGAFQAGTLLN
jgi:thioredoxin reductase